MLWLEMIDSLLALINVIGLSPFVSSSQIYPDDLVPPTLPRPKPPLRHTNNQAQQTHPSPLPSCAPLPISKATNSFPSPQPTTNSGCLPPFAVSRGSRGTSGTSPAAAPARPARGSTVCVCVLFCVLQDSVWVIGRERRGGECGSSVCCDGKVLESGWVVGGESHGWAGKRAARAVQQQDPTQTHIHPTTPF